MLRVDTTVENASNQVSAEHLYDMEKSTEIKAPNLHKTTKLTQTFPTKIEEKPKFTPQTGEHALKQVDKEIPVQVHHSKAQDEKQQLQLRSTKPKERAINLSDLILLLETQFPNLPVTLHQEEPSTAASSKSPNQTPVMSPTSVRHQFTPGSRNNLQCSTSTSAPNP